MKEQDLPGFRGKIFAFQLSREALEQSVTALWGTVTVILPVCPRRDRNICWMEINQT